jgi:hypothetical protein
VPVGQMDFCFEGSVHNLNNVFLNGVWEQVLRVKKYFPDYGMTHRGSVSHVWHDA